MYRAYNRSARSAQTAPAYQFRRRSAPACRPRPDRQAQSPLFRLCRAARHRRAAPPAATARRAPVNIVLHPSRDNAPAAASQASSRFQAPGCIRSDAQAHPRPFRAAFHNRTPPFHSPAHRSTHPPRGGTARPSRSPTALPIRNPPQRCGMHPSVRCPARSAPAPSTRCHAAHTPARSSGRSRWLR